MSHPLLHSLLIASAKTTTATATATATATTAPSSSYSSTDLDADLAMILVVLVLALILALALNAVIRFFLRIARRLRPNQPPPGKPSAQTPLSHVPITVYSSDVDLAGVGADCPICLSEFNDGERVRVLPNCRHGFHVACVEKWLSSHPSCPTCRTSCLPEKSPEIDPAVV